MTCVRTECFISELPLLPLVISYVIFIRNLWGVVLCFQSYTPFQGTCIPITLVIPKYRYDNFKLRVLHEITWKPRSQIFPFASMLSLFQTFIDGTTTHQLYQCSAEYRHLHICTNPTVLDKTQSFSHFSQNSLVSATSTGKCMTTVVIPNDNPSRTFVFASRYYNSMHSNSLTIKKHLLNIVSQFPLMP